MLLPEEEEYNKKLEEVDEILDVLKDINGKYADQKWGFHDAQKDVERLIFEIEHNKPHRRKIFEPKSVQGLSRYGVEHLTIAEENKEEFKEVHVEVDNGNIWSKIAKAFNNLIGRLFKNSTPAIESQSTIDTIDDIKSESNNTQNETITLKGMEIPKRESFDSTIISIESDEEQLLAEKIKFSGINMTRIEKALGIQFNLKDVDWYDYLREVANEIEANREQIMAKIHEKLLKLEEASSILDAVYEKKIAEEHIGKLKSQEVVVTSVREDYRQSSWGNVRRICLDGFQNHLPEDSLGTKCYVEFLVGNKWVDIETAKTHKDKIKEVRFVDNGVGYTVDSLLFLGSNKTSEDMSVGQFGEGLKLIAMAAVNMGLGLEFQSRNWSATATAVETTTLNTREGDREEKHKALAFDIKVYDETPIIGSKTIFHTPTQEFIDYALNLKEQIVALKDKKVEYSENEENGIDIVDTDKGGIYFVKGIHLRDVNSFFQYNFRSADVNPDRNSFNNYDASRQLEFFYARLKEISIMKKLLKKLMIYQLSIDSEKKNDPNCDNSNFITPVEYGLSCDTRINCEKLWQQAFQEVCLEMGLKKEGQTAIIVDDEEDKDRKISDEYAEVTCLPWNWKDFLKRAGVKTRASVMPEYQKVEIETSLTEDVGKENWNYPRVVIDVIQNHLPEDSKGKTFVRFQTKDKKWHNYSELHKYKNFEIYRIKICDSGVGYDYNNLGLIASVKDKNGAGRFGEGLKMIALAILRFQKEERNFQNIEFRSRDWVGVPKLVEVVLNKGQKREKKVSRLAFDVMSEINPKSSLLRDDEQEFRDEDGNWVKSSEIKSKTIINNPSDQMINEFRTLGEKVLAFSNKKPIHIPGVSYDILDYYSGKVYVKGLFVEKRPDLLFSYNLKGFDIKNRDRNEVNNKDIDEMIRNIYKTTQDEKLISKYISEAVRVTQEGKSHRYREFNTRLFIPPRSSQASLWISIFKEKYGENAGIVSSDNINYSEIYRAKHLGIKLIPIPASLYRALDDLTGMYGEKLPTYKTLVDQAVEAAVPVDEENLSTEEKEKLNKLYKLNSILKLVGERPVKKIEIYDYPKDYAGERVEGFYTEGEEDTIHISRNTINSSLTTAADVFFHECDHMITGAEDPEARFRDCLSTWLGILALQVCDLVESVQDGGLYEDITMSDVREAIKEITDLLSEHKRSKMVNLGEESGDDTKTGKSTNLDENPTDSILGEIE